MKPTRKQIQAQIRKLRKLVEHSANDPVLSRIAYAVECNLRWAIEDTTGWDTPFDDAQKQAAILRYELAPRR